MMNVRWNWVLLFCVALIVTTLSTYWPALSSEFVNLDDGEYVSSNSTVLQGIGYYGWLYAWTTFDLTNWHPLMWLSLELDSTIWGTSPTGYHATNVIIHIVNSLLLFFVLTRLTNQLWPSAWVAAFFAVHPLHVESVAWISERKDVLSGLFLLLTLFAYQILVGEIELVNKNPYRAKSYFGKALQLNPKDPDTYVRLASAQLQLEKWNDAKLSLRRALELAPKNAVAHFQLAQVLEMQNDRAGARDHFEAATKIDPTNPDFRQRFEQSLGKP